MSEDNKSTYYVKYQCGNCGHSGGAEVPFGIRVNEFLSMKECGGCGCHSLHESHEPRFKSDKVWMKAHS